MLFEPGALGGVFTGIYFSSDQVGVEVWIYLLLWMGRWMNATWMDGWMNRQCCLGLELWGECLLEYNLVVIK